MLKRNTESKASIVSHGSLVFSTTLQTQITELKQQLRDVDVKEQQLKDKFLYISSAQYYRDQNALRTQFCTQIINNLSQSIDQLGGKKPGLKKGTDQTVCIVQLSQAFVEACASQISNIASKREELRKSKQCVIDISQ